MNSRTLEHKLFSSSMRFGLMLIGVLFIHDSFINPAWFSLVLEFFAAILMVANLVLLNKRPPTDLQILVFGVFLLSIINLGWLTGGGANLINVSVYFLCIGMLMLLMNKRFYVLLGVFVSLDLLILFYLEGVIGLEHLGLPVIENNVALEVEYLYAAILFFFGGFLVAFIKVNYNTDRDKLSELNRELQNTQQELHETVAELEEQQSELAKTKGSLEVMVEDRTRDLAQANERLLNKNQQLEQYSYIISHNLKAPVAQIKGLAHLLPINESFDTVTQETIERLRDSALNLEKVLIDLSTVLRIEKNIQQQWQQVNLQEILDEVVDSLKNTLRERDVKFIRDATVLPFITAIRPYVYSILHNIIENAVKYADFNKDFMQVKVDFSELPRFYQITITDNGIGIDMEAASGKIFQMYQRFNTTHPGQGFGLYLVKSQMDALNGQVEMDSVLGQGTTFKLYFNKTP